MTAGTLLQEKCPVKINTGELIKTLRQEALEGPPGQTTPTGAAVAGFVARNFGPIAKVVPPMLDAVSMAHGLLGEREIISPRT